MTFLHVTFVQLILLGPTQIYCLDVTLVGVFFSHVFIII